MWNRCMACAVLKIFYWKRQIIKNDFLIAIVKPCCILFYRTVT